MDESKIHKIIVIGAGLSGLITAIAFSRNNIPVTIFEKSKNHQESKDPRTTSLNFRSVAILKKYNIWQELEEFATPIEDIYVLDNYAPNVLHFSGSEVLDENSKMGYMMENHILRDRLREITKNIDIRYESNLEFIDQIELNKVVVEDGQNKISPDLIVACDGKFSLIREKFFENILDKSYAQKAIVLNIWHEKSHNNIAVEHFMPKGPFAILPLKDPHQSSIVWSEKEESANLYLQMKKEEFSVHIKQKIGSFLGDVKIITEICSYPLSAHVTKEYFYKNIALIADSAHSIHPLAGQGLNIGIQDIDALVSIVTRYQNVGLKLDETALQQYSKQRFWSNLIMFNAMDFLNLLFSNESKVISRLRRFGMSMINSSSFVKKFLMQKAMGE